MLALEKLDLKRIPAIKADVLRAWDRADELVVNYLLTNHDQLLDKARTLVINDEFGAISCGILSGNKQADVTVWGDSYISECSLYNNCQANGLIPPTFINAMTTPQGPFATVILRLPKSHSLLIDQLTRLLPQLSSQTQVIVAVMVKHLDTSWYTQLTKQLGCLVPSLTVKKARLFFAQPHSQPRNQDNLGPNLDEHLTMASPPTASIVNSWQYRSWQLSHYSGVYGRRRIDEGAAFC